MLRKKEQKKEKLSGINKSLKMQRKKKRKMLKMMMIEEKRKWGEAVTVKDGATQRLRSE